MATNSTSGGCRPGWASLPLPAASGGELASAPWLHLPARFLANHLTGKRTMGVAASPPPTPRHAQQNNQREAQAIPSGLELCRRFRSKGFRTYKAFQSQSSWGSGTFLRPRAHRSSKLCFHSAWDWAGGRGDGGAWTECCFSWAAIATSESEGREACCSRQGGCDSPSE